MLPAVAKQAGYEIVSENELWNINWSDIPLAQDKIMQMRRIQDMYSVFWGLNAPLQRMNHFPGMYEICRKDRLGRNLNRHKRLFPNDYNFFPETWDLPTEGADVISFIRRRKNVTFIVKPESGCQGKGIFLLRNMKKLSPFTRCVCQVYVPHPFLIDGYKFDQRIYVLITCVDPLRLYIYDEGIARFATVKYEAPTDDNLEVVFMHLTNYSLNKFSESYVREGDGSKRKLSSIYQWMSENGIDVPRLLHSIDDVVVKTILCAAPTLRHNYKASFPKRDRGCSCFELLGFDILLDRNLNPVVLEVNHSPSFNLDLPVDSEVKTSLLTDLLNMVYLGDALGAMGMTQQGPSKPTSGTMKKNSSKSAKKGVTPPPTDTPPEECYRITNKALIRQFQHEMKNRGKFRLIYSSDRPGVYARLTEDHYCMNLTHEVEQSLRKKRGTAVTFDNDVVEYPKTKSTLKTTKAGQVYVETTVVGHMSNGPVQKFRETMPGVRTTTIRSQQGNHHTEQRTGHRYGEHKTSRFKAKSKPNPLYGEIESEYSVRDNNNNVIKVIHSRKHNISSSSNSNKGDDQRYFSHSFPFYGHISWTLGVFEKQSFVTPVIFFCNKYNNFILITRLIYQQLQFLNSVSVTFSTR